MLLKCSKSYFWGRQTIKSLYSDLVLEGEGTLWRVIYYFSQNNYYYMNLQANFKLWNPHWGVPLHTSETIFPKLSNHHGEGYISVTCQVFFFTRQKNILSLLSGSRPWGTLIYQGMKKYFAKNVEYIYRWQSNCMHPLWGSGNGEREVKDFQWNEEKFPFSEDFLSSDITLKVFLFVPLLILSAFLEIF